MKKKYLVYTISLLILFFFSCKTTKNDLDNKSEKFIKSILMHDDRAFWVNIDTSEFIANILSKEFLSDKLPKVTKDQIPMLFYLKYSPYFKFPMGYRNMVDDLKVNVIKFKNENDKFSCSLTWKLPTLDSTDSQIILIFKSKNSNYRITDIILVNK